MKAVLRWLWHCIPAPIRYRLYRGMMDSGNVWIRHGMAAFLKVTLYGHRHAAKKLWPDARGLDHAALVFCLLMFHFHGPALGGLWRHGHLLRRWRRPQPVKPSNRTVLHVTGSFDLGGTQTQIKFLCTAADARYRHTAIEIFPEMNYLYRQGATVDAARFKGRGLWSRTAGRLVVHMGYRSSQLVQAYKLVCDFRAEKPAVVVGWGHEMCVTTFIAAAVARVPRIVFCIRTVNPTYGWVEPPFPRLLLCAHKSMTPLVDLVAVNSTLLRDDHAAWVGMPASEIAVCANGIALSERPAEQSAEARVRVRRELGVPDEAVVITNVGRFSNEKGQPTLVEANRLLLARRPPVAFVWVLCGDGPTLPMLRERAESLGMTNMFFIGRTNAVRDFLSASDIFVMPSDFEGMPNAMLEAMEVGLPCVSTRRSGATDIARDGVEALYYEARDSLTLAQHLDRLITDAELRRALGAAAAARVREFPIGRFVSAFESAVDATAIHPQART